MVLQSTVEDARSWEVVKVQGGDGELVFDGDSFSVGKWRTRETDDGESYRAMWMYLVPLNCS